MDREQENKWIWKRVQDGETLDDFLRHRYPRKLSEAELQAVYVEIEEKFFKPFVDTDIIDVMIPNDQSWDAILKLLQKSNFSIGDAFQLDAAIGSGCNIFITNDSQLVKMVNDAKLIPASRPEELDKKLAEIGIRSIV
jgi:predicted nucleic acid-binding protein